MNRHRLMSLAGASAGWLLAACSATPTAPPAASPTAAEPAAPAAPAAPAVSATENPLLAESSLPYGLPRFARLRSEHFLPAFEQGMAGHLREIEAIAGDTRVPTAENTVVAMERAGRLLGRVARTFSNLNGAHTSDALKQIDTQMSPRLAAHSDAIYLNAALYARVKAVFDARESLALDAETLRLVEKYHADFVRAGAQLDAAGKERMKALNAELATLSTRFKQNLLEDTNALALVLETRDELNGLPEDAIGAAAEAARARGLEGKYVLTLQLPTGQPALAQLRHRAVREKLFKASVARGNRGNDQDNKAVLSRIAQLRAQRAQLLGYASHAEYQLELQTARTPSAVNTLLRQLAPAAAANARREAADLRKIALERGEDPKTFRLQPWDWAFYTEQLRKARYDFDESEMKPYFQLDRVLKDGAFFMAQELYGLTFREREDLPAYHEDVRVFEVLDADEAPLGLMLFDPFARESKRGGAWAAAWVPQNELFGDSPVIGIHLNIPKPAKGRKALLTYDETNTLFHEFGHALHGLFSSVTYPYFAGTAVPRDFVEYPSQVHEMWVTWPAILKNYARHVDSGEAMPQALVDKVKAAEKFNQGFATTEYLAASLLDQAWHQLTPEQAAAIKDVAAFEAAALEKAGVDLPEVPPRYRSTYFNHIFSGGYSAGYYSYIWSEVLDADTVGWFREQGGLQRINGDWFRAKLLSKGGSVEAMTLFRLFRGRDPDIGPLLERRGLQQAPQPRGGPAPKAGR